MGVVYYANYFVWFEVARTEWLRHAGWTYREMEAEGIALPVIDAHCTYQQPVRYDDEVDILTKATLVSPVRIRFDYAVSVLAGARRCAEGYTVHAAIDPEGRPQRLPPRVLELLR